MSKSEAVPESRNYQSDASVKREKALAILENQQSGNPFGDTQEANSMNKNYWPTGKRILHWDMFSRLVYILICV